MCSIQSEISGSTLANQVRLERAVHTGSFFLVEGNSDAKLFGKFIDGEKCSIVVCIGRERLLEAISILKRQAFTGALGFADKDFADDVGYPHYEGAVVFTDKNDIVISIICSAALTNIANEFGVKKRIGAVVEATGKAICDLVFEAASPIGALRLLSIKNRWSLKFSGMSYKFANAHLPEIDINRTINHVAQRSNVVGLPTINEIRQQVDEIIRSTYDLWRICQGHDCVRVLGRAFHKQLGNSNRFNSDDGATHLEGILRLAYEYAFFVETEAFHRIREWEHSSGYRILK